ncbi:MAG: hypothetical protein PHD43_02330 [Methylococcales bacterium]|nr:hypothetical protein [Methylococcales bacterium]
MKTAIHSITALLVIAMLLLATCCQTVATTHTQDVGSPKYPPSDENVDAGKIEEPLRQEAARLGADALGACPRTNMLVSGYQYVVLFHSFKALYIVGELVKR